MDPPAYVNPQRLEQRLVPTRRSRGVACNPGNGASGGERTVLGRTKRSPEFSTELSELRTKAREYAAHNLLKYFALQCSANRCLGTILRSRRRSSALPWRAQMIGGIDGPNKLNQARGRSGGYPDGQGNHSVRQRRRSRPAPRCASRPLGALDSRSAPTRSHYSVLGRCSGRAQITSQCIQSVCPGSDFPAGDDPHSQACTSGRYARAIRCAEKSSSKRWRTRARR
ncbi:hypothetical protein V1273_003690 [Bradyrhizobium sp. AZCC 1721]